MPSKNILAVSIVCIALTVSIWLIAKTPSLDEVRKANEKIAVDNVYTSPYEKIVSENDDSWKKILTNVDSKTNEVKSVVSTDSSSGFDDTTVTSQLAVNVLARYLSEKKGDTPLTDEQKVKIVNDIYSNPIYLETTPVRYVKINLKIVADSSQNLTEYKNKFRENFTKSVQSVKDNPVIIFMDYMKTDNVKVLERIDPVIVVAKGFISDFLNMNVPQKMVSAHLGVINSMSAILSDLEAVKVTENDPMKALSFLNQYQNNMETFLANVNIATKDFKNY